jgi:hypothetical protein
VHLDAILGNYQLDALSFNVFILYLYMFRAASAHHQDVQIVLTPDDVLIQFAARNMYRHEINTLKKSASSW